MQLTITEAAKLYGKQRKTLYRHIDAGRLSCSTRGDGHRVLDLSELIRCYGEPSQALPADDTPMTREAPQGDTLLTRALLEELRGVRAELVALREEVHQLRALPAPMADKVDTVDAPRERPEKPQETRKPEPGREDGISFADLEARLAARLGRQS